MIDEIANAHALAELLALDDLARCAGDRRAVDELLGALLMAEQLAAQGIGTGLLPDLEAAHLVLQRVRCRPAPIGITSGELVLLRAVLEAVHEQRGLAGFAQLVSALVVLVGWRWGWVAAQTQTGETACATLRAKAMNAIADLEQAIGSARDSARAAPEATALTEARPAGDGTERPPITVDTAVARFDEASDAFRTRAAGLAAVAANIRAQPGGYAGYPLDPHDEKYAELTALEATFRDLAQAQWKASRRRDLMKAVAMRRAMERVALACEAMVAAARDLKGAVQAHDASDLFATGRVPACAPEELASVMRKITGA